MSHCPVERALPVVPLLLASMAACTGLIDAPAIDEPGAASSAAGNGGNAGSKRDGAGGKQPPPAPAAELPWPASFDGAPAPMRRLSRDELVATMRALIGVAPARQSLPADHRHTHAAPHTNAGAALLAQEVDTLALAIDAIAPQAGKTLLARSGCKATAQAQRDCLGKFAGTFAETALRRPLPAAERARLATLFADTGASATDDAEALADLVRGVFQSPSFLYRSEVGTGELVAGRPGVRRLSDTDVAVRLAFLATQTPPDASLLEAAAAGRLSDERERLRQLDRLLATPAGKEAMTAFVLEHLGASESLVNEKAAKYREGLGAGFADALRESAAASIGSVLASPTPTLEAALTMASYRDDAPVASLRAGGAADPRVGAFMHPHVLAAHTKETGVSPFGIGKFLRENLLCEPIPPPPADAVNQARADAPTGLTVRQSLEYRTNTAAVCSACHNSFAPLGYAFLPFDPVGRYVAADPSGKPWDLAGELAPSGGERLTFDGPAALMQTLARHEQTHGCFAQAALVWALGRRPVPQDEALLASLSDVSLRTHGSVPELYRALVASPQFLVSVIAR